MKASLPFSAFKRKQNFTTTIQVAIPFREFLILKMTPGIFMYRFKPFKAILRPGELISL